MGVTGCWEIVWLYWFLPPYQRTKSLACKAQRPLTLVLPFGFLPDLTRVKFGSACPPLGKCYRARPPGQTLPDLRPSGSPQPPLPCGLRLQAIGPINLPLADCSDGPLALGLGGRFGRSGATSVDLSQPDPFGRVPQRLLYPSVSCRSSNRPDRPTPPCPTPRVKPGVAASPSGRATCHRRVAQTVLWHPTFAGAAGSQGRRATTAPACPANRRSRRFRRRSGLP